MAEAFRTVRPGDTRAFTHAIMDLVDEGIIDKDVLITELLLWLSEDEVEQFCDRNLMLRDEDNEPIIRRESEDEFDELADPDME